MSAVHTGDRILNKVLNRLKDAYRTPESRAEELLRQYLKPLLNGLKPQADEKKMGYYLRFMRAFSDIRWARTRKKIASLFSGVDATVLSWINDAMIDAFTDGLNAAAYLLSRFGVDVYPITSEIVKKLVAQKVINLHKRKLKKRNDVAYNEQRIQSAIHAAIYQGITPEELPGYVAEMLSKTRQRETAATAQAYIYSASDSGAYYAGLEAQDAGLEIEKTWLAIMDMRVRPSHRKLHGVTIPLDDVFHGDYGELRYPHDPEAPPAEIYNCRCRMVVHLKGKLPDKYGKEFLMPWDVSSYQRWRAEQIKRAGGEIELMKKHKRR